MNQHPGEKILEKINKKKIVSKNRILLLLLLKKEHKVNINAGPAGCRLLIVHVEVIIIRCYKKCIY